MSPSSEAYQNTMKKLQDARAEVKRALIGGDMERAELTLDQFRSYNTCFYCQTFRKTLDSRGFKGCCEGCPLHRYGERLHGTPVAYNGCYRIGDYNKLVLSACWFRKDPSVVALTSFLDNLEKAIEHFSRIEDKLCHSEQLVPPLG